MPLFVIVFVVCILILYFFLYFVRVLSYFENVNKYYIFVNELILTDIYRWSEISKQHSFIPKYKEHFPHS